MQHFGEFLVGTGLAFYYSWRITLVLTSTIPVLVMIGVIQGVLIYRTGSDAVYNKCILRIYISCILLDIMFP